jgi:hypothetical protein
VAGGVREQFSKELPKTTNLGGMLPQLSGASQEAGEGKSAEFAREHLEHVTSPGRF